jgi:hypothetical protein
LAGTHRRHDIAHSALGARGPRLARAAADRAAVLLLLLRAACCRRPLALGLEGAHLAELLLLGARAHPLLLKVRGHQGGVKGAVPAAGKERRAGHQQEGRWRCDGAWSMAMQHSCPASSSTGIGQLSAGSLLCPYLCGSAANTEARYSRQEASP